MTPFAVILLLLAGTAGGREVASPVSGNLPSPPWICRSEEPLRSPFDCEGFVDDRGPDRRFFRLASGRADLARCRTVRAGVADEELLKHGWTVRHRQTPCQRFGLPRGFRCMAYAREADAPQLRVEGYDRNCRSGIDLRTSHAPWVDACLDGRFLSQEQRRALRIAVQAAPPAGLRQVIRSVDRAGTSPSRPACRHLVTRGNLTIPTLRPDLEPGDRIVIRGNAWPRLRIEP